MESSDWTLRNTQYWSDTAAGYDSLYGTEWSEREDRHVEEILSRHLGHLPDDARVLDLGCGTGLGHDLLGSRSWRYIGLDVSMPSLSILQARSSTAMPVCADMGTRLPFPASTFDAAILLFSSLSYSSSWPHTVQEVYRVLRPGGVTYISTLGRFALRRLLALRLRTREDYATRGTSPRSGQAPAWRPPGHSRDTGMGSCGQGVPRPSHWHGD